MSNLPQIVLDTNVLVSGLRSKRGVSHQLLELVGAGLFEINLSVPLVLEYEEVLYRELPNLSVNRQVVDDVSWRAKTVRWIRALHFPFSIFQLSFFIFHCQAAGSLIAEKNEK
jgi:PIN domain